VISVITVGRLVEAFGRMGRSHADIHFVGMENPDQPQSRQTCTSGDGFIGGWLSVRGELR
jgi:hypothetical protein